MDEGQILSIRIVSAVGNVVCQFPEIFDHIFMPDPDLNRQSHLTGNQGQMRLQFHLASDLLFLYVGNLHTLCLFQNFLNFLIRFPHCRFGFISGCISLRRQHGRHFLSRSFCISADPDLPVAVIFVFQQNSHTMLADPAVLCVSRAVTVNILYLFCSCIVCNVHIVSVIAASRHQCLNVIQLSVLFHREPLDHPS